MHSPIDVVVGCAIGASLLIGWCIIDEYLDAFITGGENGKSRMYFLVGLWRIRMKHLIWLGSYALGFIAVSQTL